MKPRKGFIILLVCVAIIIITVLANILTADTNNDLYSQYRQVSGLREFVVW